MNGLTPKHILSTPEKQNKLERLLDKLIMNITGSPDMKKARYFYNKIVNSYSYKNYGGKREDKRFHRKQSW